MKKKVLKFGGTSVGSIDRIVHAAKIIKKEFDLGNKIIVVVSAMAGKTNELISLSKSVSNNFRHSKLNMPFESDIHFHKPVIRFDHFMMKIQEAIQQTFQDFQQGIMGIIR